MPKFDGHRATSSTQDHAAAAVVVGPHGTEEAPKGVPVFAGRRETPEEYWWAAEQMLTWEGELRQHDSRRRRRRDHDGALRWRAVREGWQCRPPRTTIRWEWKVFLSVLRKTFETDKDKWTKIAESVKGVTEETTTGVLRSTSSSGLR